MRQHVNTTPNIFTSIVQTGVGRLNQTKLTPSTMSKTSFSPEPAGDRKPELSTPQLQLDNSPELSVSVLMSEDSLRRQHFDGSAPLRCDSTGFEATISDICR